MSQYQRQRQKDQDEEPRKDLDAYCPRIDKEILLLDGRCFSPDRGPVCCECVFDVDFVYVRLILIMSEILEERGKLTC